MQSLWQLRVYKPVLGQRIDDPAESVQVSKVLSTNTDLLKKHRCPES